MRLTLCSYIKQYTYIWINAPAKKSVEKINGDTLICVRIIVVWMNTVLAIDT